MNYEEIQVLAMMALLFVAPSAIISTVAYLITGRRWWQYPAWICVPGTAVAFLTAADRSGTAGIIIPTIAAILMLLLYARSGRVTDKAPPEAKPPAGRRLHNLWEHPNVRIFQPGKWPIRSTPDI